jgi:glyoxylase-like metal-dependent hydrolase (beta-lactamase superfamily II)
MIHPKLSSLLVKLARALATVLLILPTMVTASAPSSPELRLYVLDCGRLEFQDLAPFSDTGEYDGHAGSLAEPCFLVRHPKGDLLWDSGLGDQYAAHPEGVQLPAYRAVVRKTLASQLREIGLAFGDIEYFAFSHAHADHLGNADKLAGAAWIVNPKELAWAQSTPAPPRTNAALLTARNPDTSIPINGDFDVFGDGTVRIFAAPGHTPGHQTLLVTLRRQGAILLSGDLYHSRENREGRRMPVFNVSRADTLASMDRMERILRNVRGRLVIQHSMEDFNSLPHSPEFLD